MNRTPTDPTEPAKGCPLTAAIAALGGKWALICLYWVAGQPRRFNELLRLMPEISHKVLTELLRDLEDNGLVSRREVSARPLHVEYALSAYGQGVLPLIEAMRDWGNRHLDRG